MRFVFLLDDAVHLAAETRALVLVAVDTLALDCDSLLSERDTADYPIMLKCISLCIVPPVIVDIFKASFSVITPSETRSDDVFLKSSHIRSIVIFLCDESSVDSTVAMTLRATGSPSRHSCLTSELLKLSVLILDR